MTGRRERSLYPWSVLILLPPSEGKDVPRRGRPLDLADLSFPDLTGARSRVLDKIGEGMRRFPTLNMEGLAPSPETEAKPA